MKPYGLALLALLGCGPHHAPAAKESAIGRARRPPSRPTTAAESTSANGTPPSVSSHLVASVLDHTVGPWLARGPSGRMVAYIETGASGARRVVSVPLNPDGAPKAARVVASTGTDSTTLVLRPAGGGDGFIAAWTNLTDRGEALSVVGIGADGTPSGAAVEVGRTNDDIVWVEIVPTSHGSVCVWAEETRGADANVLAIALDASGKPRGVASRVAHGVIGWQAAPTTAGVALALVVPNAPVAPGAKGAVREARATTLRWLKLDADGRPVGAPIAIASTQTAIADVDVARVGDGYVFAWTDSTGLDPMVMVAAIDADNKPLAPRIATVGSGGASLVAITGQGAGAVLAWEESGKRGRPQRRVHLERLDARGAKDAGGASTVLDLDSGSVPELVLTDTGLDVLARMRACPDPPLRDAAPCSGAAVPTLVRFDTHLAVQSTEPLRLGDAHEPAQIAWGLGCEHERCSALAAVGESPVAVSSVELVPRPNRYRAPIEGTSSDDAPRLDALATLATGDSFADLAAARVGDATLLATLTSALDESGGKAGARSGATVAVRVVGPDGQLRGAPTTITRRALSVGGIAISAGGKVEDGAAIAWVARDDGDPEVHVARVDPSGKKVADVRLTMMKGDASDVAIGWADGGWLVAWVDTRDGNGEVYAAKVGRDLARLARDERITNAPGDASDVTLIASAPSTTNATSAAAPAKDAHDGLVWLAWADPRESPHDGFADIFVAALRGRDARAEVADTRVLATAAHSRSPSLANAEDGGAVLGWIEEAPMGVDVPNSGAYGAMIAWIDAKGHAVAEPERTHGASEGSPTSIVLDGAGTSLHAILARRAHDEVILDAIALSRPRSAALAPFAVLGLDGPPSLDVSMTLLGDSLFFNDEGPDAGDGRARRATLTWKR